MDLAKSVALSFSRFGLDASSEKLYYSLEDSADRWNFSYTFVLLCLMCTVSTANVYFLRSFECTTLQDSPGGSNVHGFIQATCWTQGTVALTGNDSTPSSPEEWTYFANQGKVSFYQWVPFVLGLQAIMFLIPHLIWDFMASHTFGEDTNILLERAIKASKEEDPKTRELKVDVVASQITRICIHTVDNRTTKWARAQRWMTKKIPGGKLFTVGKRLGNRIAVYYLITKVLYLVNLVGQLYLIKTFLTYGRYDSLLTQSSELIHFAYYLMMSLFDVADWEGGGSLLFPRRSYCIVPLRGFGSRQNTYIASCSLPVNMYNEKLYVFLWIWLSVVFCITTVSLISWMFKLLCFQSSESFLETMLKNANHGMTEHPFTKATLKQFIERSIRPDGVLLLRMIKTNAGAIIAAEISLRAWNQFYELRSRWNPIAEDLETTQMATLPRGVDKTACFYPEFPPHFADATAPPKSEDADYAESPFVKEHRLDSV